MTTIADISRIVRSKNAGPYRLTLDVVFKDADAYRAARESEALSPASVAALYGLPPDHVTNFVWFDLGNALKVTFLRPVPAASIGDGDVYGSQHHAPLLTMPVPILIASGV